MDANAEILNDYLDELDRTFLATVAANLNTDEADVKDRLRALGYDSIPKIAAERPVLYRTLRKDMRNDTAEQPVLVDVENGAYAE